MVSSFRKAAYLLSSSNIGCRLISIAPLLVRRLGLWRSSSRYATLSVQIGESRRPVITIRMIAAINVILLAGCTGHVDNSGGERVSLTELEMPQTRSIDAASMSIVDLTKRVSATEHKFAAGFNRVGDSFLEQTLGEALKRDLAKVIQPTGQYGAVDVWIVDGGFYWEKTGMDFVPIVSIFSYGRSGRLRCDATLTVRLGATSDKFTEEHYIRVAQAPEGANVIAACYSALLKSVTRRIAAFK